MFEADLDFACSLLAGSLNMPNVGGRGALPVLPALVLLWKLWRLGMESFLIFWGEFSFLP